MACYNGSNGSLAHADRSYSELVSAVPSMDGWAPDKDALEATVLRISEAIAGTRFLAVYAPCVNPPLLL